MVKTCKRLLDWIQLVNAEGDIRVCCYARDNIIGNLQKDSLGSIINGDKAKKLRKMIADGNFSNCPADNCPYQANGRMDDILVDYDENMDVKPEELYLAYEGNCNYKCTCCTSYQHMIDTRNNDYTELYDQLEANIKGALPYIKHISANGRGEVFASPRIMKILSEWEPIAPIGEVRALLETNGSLFNEKNWKKIENLGKYNLTVAVTVMSFDEATYQYLSGTTLPISNLIDNLKFMKKLREEGTINHLEIATVMQELNFREMPSFARRCLDEFGADSVRIRPIFYGGGLSRKTFAFMDVRNSRHPYHVLYKKIMSDEIFKDKHVLLWSGAMDSDGDNTVSRNMVERNLRTYIYGAGFFGQRLYNYLNNNEMCDIDGFVQSQAPCKSFVCDKLVTGYDFIPNERSRFLLAINDKNVVCEIKQKLLSDGHKVEDWSDFIRDNLI